MKIAIDATRNRSGGAKIHLKGILKNFEPEQPDDKVHLYSYTTLLSELPDYPWLIKHTHPMINMNLAFQIFWQKFILPNNLKENSCDILLSTDAGTFCRFKPSIVMSRDMLSYEEGMISLYPRLSFSRFRLQALRYVQSASLSKAEGVIYLTNYAKEVISQTTRSENLMRVIPHGVTEIFSNCSVDTLYNHSPIVLTYVSNIAPYKNQLSVLKAILDLVKKFDIQLNLVGGGSGFYYENVLKFINENPSLSQRVTVFPQLDHTEIVNLFKNTSIFLFASSCENMPNTLIEAMSSGLPIACSNKGPMPEVLKDAGVYFDPTKPNEISDAVEKLISSSELRKVLSSRSLELSKYFSWEKCSEETFSFIKHVQRKFKND